MSGRLASGRGPRVTIDLRMINHSGIGTYLRNTVPAVVESRPSVRFTLLGDPAELRELMGDSPRNWDVRELRAPIYSISEQLAAWRATPRDTTVYWSPHYTIPLLYRGRLLVTVCDVCHLALPELFGGLHKRLYARLMFQAVRRRADAIITISDFTRKEFLKLVGQPRGSIRPVLLAAAPSWFELNGGGNGRRPEPPYLLYVGNVKPHKNLSALLDAFGELRESLPHDLVIVGREDGFITGDPRVREAARALGGRVRFTGRVSQEELERYFAQADALVFPSLYEGFGLPPLEAMACGCPVVASSAASLPEICGDAALYFDPGDRAGLVAAIRRVTSDGALRESLRARGKRRAAEFSYDRCARETLEVLDGLLAGAAGPRAAAAS